uniref:Uncharacterized protein n=1 Tax=Panagrolaimus sp. ES5 TaxID=591445 RepID=A0AC34FK21_9BILA
MLKEFSIVSIAAAVTIGIASAQGDRHGSLAKETDAFKEFLEAVNPAYLIIVGCLIAAGCAFELAYGTRGSSGRTDWSHVTSRQQPYSV